MSDMREEFEKWALKHTTLCLDRHKTGNYMKYASNVAWRAWQAARTVPEGFVMVPVEILQLIQCDVENSADWLSNSTSVLRNLLAAAPEPKK